MMKKFSLFLLCLVTSICFASPPTKCAEADETTKSTFCASFAAVATCHCLESHVPSFACQNMNFLYNAMLAQYTTLERACASQTYTKPQNCIDSWNCYRLGGYNSAGGACSGTGSSC